MTFLLFILLLVHGLIHLLGFVKSINPGLVKSLREPVSRPAGFLWFATTLLLIVAAAMYFIGAGEWWVPALPAILFSQGLIISHWKEARYGTIANAILAIAVTVAMLDLLPSSYPNRYGNAVEERLSSHSSTDLLTETDIAALPEPVRKYLRFTGSVGNPRVHAFRAAFTGSMRKDPTGGWMTIRSQQYNFVDDPARFFYIRSTMFGIPFDGFHHYAGGEAVMLIRLANLLQVVDAKGPEMNQGETVTVFNDMCLLAPATLTDPRISWQPLNDTMVIASFTNRGVTVSATLIFNQAGALVNFISRDRFLSTDGKHYQNYPWSTPVRNYKEMNGRRVPAYGEAIWHTPNGSFSYARFNIQSVEYNPKEFRFNMHWKKRDNE
jgi:hypothetical protein